MTEYDDPALDEVRSWYIDGRRVHNPFASDAALVARFDSWLAEHDREIREDERKRIATWVESMPLFRPGDYVVLNAPVDIAAAIRGGNA